LNRIRVSSDLVAGTGHAFVERGGEGVVIDRMAEERAQVVAGGFESGLQIGMLKAREGNDRVRRRGSPEGTA
jgi:hypothetical protein